MLPKSRSQIRPKDVRRELGLPLHQLHSSFVPRCEAANQRSYSHHLLTAISMYSSSLLFLHLRDVVLIASEVIRQSNQSSSDEV